MIAKVNILCTKVIQTPIGSAKDNTILTGYKVGVIGMLSQKIEYVADECEQSVHAAHFVVPFSAFIVLPSDFNPSTQPLPKVVGYVEDIVAKQLDKRKIFKNITILLDIPSFCV